MTTEEQIAEARASGYSHGWCDRADMALVREQRFREALEFIRDNGMTATKELIVHMANHALANAQGEPRR